MALAARTTRLALRLPGRTLRMRLTLLYGGLFLLSGAALLAITYLLVRHATAGFIFHGEDGSTGTIMGSGGGAPRAAMQLRATAPGALPPLSPAQLAEQSAALQRLATAQHADVLRQLIVQSGIALAAMTVASIALGWVVAGRVLRPLRTITTAARDISATNLNQRLALAGPEDELKELGDTFDGLLGRLEASFDAQRRFVANASHELRTPLARQRTVAQVAVADPDATVASLRAAHERVLVSGAEQEKLIEALLTLTRGQIGLDRREPLDLADLTDEVVLARAAEADARGVALEAALARAPASGDARLVRHLAANLVDNALRHNALGGRVEVVTATRGDHAVLTVVNTGPVVGADAVEQLFQPFRRLGADRMRQAEGLGLGLSIVQAIADAHDAAIEVRPRPAGGLDVSVRFPVRPGA